MTLLLGMWKDGRHSLLSVEEGGVGMKGGQSERIRLGLKPLRTSPNLSRGSGLGSENIYINRGHGKESGGGEGILKRWV